jgi:hypothetical protein
VTDNGLAALAAALYSVNVSPHTEETDPQFAEWAAAILGERGVFLPDGRFPEGKYPDGSIVVSVAESASFIEDEYPDEIAYIQAEQAATIATLRAVEKAALVIAKMDPWYQDPDDGWVCVFCGTRPITGQQHDSECSWEVLRAALATAKENS